MLLALQIAAFLSPESVFRARTASNHESYVGKPYGINERDNQQLGYHFRLLSIIYVYDPNLRYAEIWRAAAATVHLSVCD